MYTTKRGLDFTGYVIRKHKACGGTTRVHVGTGDPNLWLYDFSAPRGRWGQPSATTPCSKCGQKLLLENFNRIYGRYVEDRLCDGRCMGATGPNCECQCGGANHGKAHDIDD